MSTNSHDYYIDSLHLKNIRKFKELNIKFNSGVNFLVGPNGSGKTSVLRAIAMCLSDNSLEDSRWGDDAEVWIDFIFNKKTYRLGRDVGWGKVFSYRNYKLSKHDAPKADEGTISANPLQFYGEESDLHLFAPLFIGAFRKINYQQVHGVARESSIIEQKSRYRNTAAESLNGSTLPNLKQWLINRYFIIDKDWAEIEKANWMWLLENLEKIAPKNNSFSFKEIGRDLEPKFILNNQETYLEELSAGFQSILSIIFSIFEWIEVTNDNQDGLVKYAKGTVIIDEIDVHLHPEWQLTIMNSMRQIFPEIQFIVTTHSPHIIATAKQEEVIVLTDENVMNLKPSKKTFSGWTTDQILEDVMKVSSLENKAYSHLIDEAYGFISINDEAGLRNSIKKIENVIHPNDTVIEVLKIQLAKLILDNNGEER